jgi:hypothetical protein
MNHSLHTPLAAPIPPESPSVIPAWRNSSLKIRNSKFLFPHSNTIRFDLFFNLKRILSSPIRPALGFRGSGTLCPYFGYRRGVIETNTPPLVSLRGAIFATTCARFLGRQSPSWWRIFTHRSYSFLFRFALPQEARGICIPLHSACKPYGIERISGRFFGTNLKMGL